MSDVKVVFARQLRKASTDAERYLWLHLRTKQLAGLRFRRQHPIGPYIVDFVCLEKRLVVELDGGQHQIQEKKDKIRDEWLTSEGYTVLRYWNDEVFTNIAGILEAISNACAQTPSPSPPPLEGGGI